MNIPSLFRMWIFNLVVPLRARERFGAIGQSGSIAFIERLRRTLDRGLTVVQ